jgi:hypothetical protein
MHPKGSSCQDILQLIVDKYSTERIDPSLVDNMFKEANIWFALPGSGTENRLFNQALGKRWVGYAENLRCKCIVKKRPLFSGGFRD